MGMAAARWRAVWPAGWRAAAWPSRASLPAWVGTVALAGALVLAAGVTPGWQAEQAQADARRAAALRAAADAPAAPPPQDAVARLLQALPPADQAADRVAALTGLARLHGVTVDGTRLGRTAPPPGAAQLPAQQLPVSMVAHGPYPAVRRFVAEALQHDDALLLARLRLGRPSPQAPEVAVDLQWLLLQRAPSAGGDHPGARGGPANARDRSADRVARSSTRGAGPATAGAGPAATGGRP